MAQLQQLMNSNEDYDFRRARDQYTVELRKENRQQIFYKRRQTAQQTNIQHQSQGNSPLLIVDQQLRPLIQSIMKESFDQTAIPQFCLDLQSENTYQQHRAVIGLRTLVSQSQSPQKTQKIIDCGAVLPLLGLMRQSKRTQLQLQSCWILTNIACGSHSQCESIIDKNGLDVFLHLLYENKPVISEQALWGIGNIAGDCHAFRDMVLTKGGLECLIRIVENTNVSSLMRHGIWALSNLCRGAPLPHYDIIKPAISVIARAILSGFIEGDVLSDSLWVLASHCEGQKSRIQRLVQIQGFVGKVLQICKNSSAKETLVPALRIIGNISTGNQKQTDSVLQEGGLQVLRKLLESKLKTVRRETCWTISNICAGSSKQTTQVLANWQLLVKISHLFFGDDLDVRREICFIFSNMCRLDDPLPVFNLIAECQIVAGIFLMIDQDQDARAIEVALQTLDDVLAMDNKVSPSTRPLYKQVQQIPGCLERLQHLQRHNSRAVYINVVRLFQKYFVLEEELF